jgi:hypothetical protein
MEPAQVPPGKVRKAPRRRAIVLAILALAGCTCLVLASVVWYAVGALTAPRGPEWGSQYSTHGMSIRLVEVGRRSSPGRSEVDYRIEASGVPRLLSFVLWSRQLSKAPRSLEGAVYLDSGGRLVHASDPSTELVLTVGEFARGEPFEIALISEDGTTRVYGRLIPFPLEAVGPGGCRLEVELARDDGKMFRIAGNGFAPGEQVTVNGQVSTVRADGTLTPTILFPEVIGKTSGQILWNVKGAGCATEVKFEWGPPALASQ